MKNRLFPNPHPIPQTLELIRLGMKTPRLPSVDGALEFRPRPLRMSNMICSNYPQRRTQFDRAFRRLRWFSTDH